MALGCSLFYSGLAALAVGGLASTTVPAVFALVHHRPGWLRSRLLPRPPSVGGLAVLVLFLGVVAAQLYYWVAVHAFQGCDPPCFMYHSAAACGYSGGHGGACKWQAAAAGGGGFCETLAAPDYAGRAGAACFVTNGALPAAMGGVSRWERLARALGQLASMLLGLLLLPISRSSSWASVLGLGWAEAVSGHSWPLTRLSFY